MGQLCQRIHCRFGNVTEMSRIGCDKSAEIFSCADPARYMHVPFFIPPFSLVPLPDDLDLAGVIDEVQL